MRILIKFSELIPKDVWISDFTMNPGSGGVFIKGFSTTFDQISAFSAALQGTIYFSSASPKSNTKVKDGSGVEVISFEMPLERRK
jgi:Tfp pilus assembly protein PilN